MAIHFNGGNGEKMSQVTGEELGLIGDEVVGCDHGDGWAPL